MLKKTSWLMALFLLLVLPSNLVGARQARLASGCSNRDKDASRPTLYLQSPPMNGPDVTYLQNTLLQLGYALPTYGADGWFGTETEAAVKDFQRRNGLEVDGAVGPITWACLNNPNAVRGNAQQPPSSNSNSGLCGEYILNTSNQSGFGGWESYFFSTSTGLYGFVSRPPFPPGYYRFKDPVISQQSATYLNGISVDLYITSWSNAEAVSGPQACQDTQAPAQPSVPIQPPPAPVLSPADVRITDFTLDDTLTNFSVLAPPTIFKSNTLWVQITNTGETTFTPPGGRGEYALQVILKQPGGKLEEYDYTSGDPLSLAPLGNLYGGESLNMAVSDLFFFTPVKNAELEVFFAPEQSLGMHNSILSKPITVNDHPDSFQRCAGTVAGALIKIAKIACTECRAALTLPDLASRIVKCGSDGACLAKESAKWLVGLVLGRFGDAGQFLSLAADALYAMAEGGNVPCMSFTDFTNAYLRELIRTRVGVNGVITESPVYPLVTNSAGEMAGFRENGEIVQDIPGSQVIVLGEDRFVLFPGEGDATLQVIGFADGEMNLYTTFNQKPGFAYAVRYMNVAVTQGMYGYIHSTDKSHTLQIDDNRDQAMDRSVQPDETIVVLESGEYTKVLQPAPADAPAAVPPIVVEQAPPQNAPAEPQPPSGICNSTAGLLILPLALAVWRQKRKW
jgi:peptidoglycan hydrolase-like protein with peptidoglycan-binding domain